MRVEGAFGTEERSEVRSFFGALCLVLCLLGGVAACLWSEYNTTKATAGRGALGLSFSLEEGLPVLRDGETGEALVLLPPTERERLYPLLPASVRVWWQIFENESAYIQKIWRFFAGLGRGEGGLGNSRAVCAPVKASVG